MATGKMNVLKIILVVLCLTNAVLSASWSYDFSAKDGPDDWDKVDSKCGGSKQSPIDINEQIVEVDENLGVFDRKIFAKKFTGLDLLNNGHALVVAINNGTYVINDASVLPASYELVQFHFHWGKGAKLPGSEHTMNGKRYFGELHLVHYNTKYSDIGEALDKSDGLAVLGFFVEASYPQDNLAMNRLLDLLDGAKNAGEAYKLTEEQLFSMETLLPCDLSMYYRYQGSLTTPTCDESVTWTVFKEPIKISARQAGVLATSLMHKKDNKTYEIQNNFRPVQDLNGRTIYRPTFQWVKAGSAALTASLMLNCVLFAAAFLAIN